MLLHCQAAVRRHHWIVWVTTWNYEKNKKKKWRKNLTSVQSWLSYVTTADWSRLFWIENVWRQLTAWEVYIDRLLCATKMHLKLQSRFNMMDRLRWLRWHECLSLREDILCQMTSTLPQNVSSSWMKQFTFWLILCRLICERSNSIPNHMKLSIRLRLW